MFAKDDAVNRTVRAISVALTAATLTNLSPVWAQVPGVPGTQLRPLAAPATSAPSGMLTGQVKSEMAAAKSCFRKGNGLMPKGCFAKSWSAIQPTCQLLSV